MDGIFIGPYDLSVSLDIPGQTESSQIIDAVKRVVAACKAEGKFTIIYTDKVEGIQKNYDLGVDSVTYSSDASILSGMLTEIIDQVKK